jgi:hypothetical protein
LPNDVKESNTFAATNAIQVRIDENVRMLAELHARWEREDEMAMIRLKRIYNFLCSMLVYTPFALCFVTLLGVFMYFPELTY